MPVYAYRCQSCGVQFEKTQKFNDKPLTKCPECRKGTVKRLLQPAAIVFKGSGWYATDHRSASGKAASKKDESASKSDASAEKPATEKAEKSDSKPEKSEKKEKKSAAKSDD
jgi:putative FmdB family regulatory protein